MRKLLLLLTLTSSAMVASVANEPASFDLYGQLFSDTCLKPFSEAGYAGITYGTSCPASEASINLQVNPLQGFFEVTTDGTGGAEARLDFYAVYLARGGASGTPVTLTWPTGFQCQGDFVRCEWTYSIVNGSPLPVGSPASADIVYGDYFRMDVSLRVELDPSVSPQSARLDYDFTQYTASDGLANLVLVPEPILWPVLLIGLGLLVARRRSVTV